MSNTLVCTARQVEIRFEACTAPGDGFAFPCDQCGRVDLDALRVQDKNDYLFARAMVGKSYFPPALFCPWPAPLAPPALPEPARAERASAANLSYRPCRLRASITH